MKRIVFALLMAVMLLSAAVSLAATHNLSALSGDPITINAASGDILTGKTEGSVVVEMSGEGSLILRDVQIAGGNTIYYGLHVKNSSPVTLILEGDNHIGCEKFRDVGNGSASVRTEGSMTITGEDGASLTAHSNKGVWGVSAEGSLTITGGITVDAKGERVGIIVSQATITNGAVVKAQGEKSGFSLSGDMLVSEGAAVTAEGGATGIRVVIDDDVEDKKITVKKASLTTSNHGESAFPFPFPSLSIYEGEFETNIKEVIVDDGYLYAENGDKSNSIPFDKIKDENGEPLDIDDRDPSVVKFSLPVKLSIQPGGGGGAAKTMSKMSGDQYTLKKANEEGLSAPAGYMFDCWEVKLKTGGKTFRMQAGDVLTLASDTTITALWKADPNYSAGSGNLPQTGDPSMLGAWVMLLGAAGAGLKMRRKE